jgi:hypothetical protein
MCLANLYRSWFIGYGIVSRGQSPAKTLFSDVQTKSNWASFRKPFPIVTIYEQASGGYQNAFDQNVPIYESTPLDFGSWSSSLGFIKANMHVPHYARSNVNRMSTIFSSASTTYKCMTNFALTQWILGAFLHVLCQALVPTSIPVRRVCCRGFKPPTSHRTSRLLWRRFRLLLGI